MHCMPSPKNGVYLSPSGDFELTEKGSFVRTWAVAVKVCLAVLPRPAHGHVVVWKTKQATEITLATLGVQAWPG